MTQLDKDGPMARLARVPVHIMYMNTTVRVDDDTPLGGFLQHGRNLKVASVLNKAPGALLRCLRHQAVHAREPLPRLLAHHDVTQYMYTLLLATHVADALSPPNAPRRCAAMCHDLIIRPVEHLPEHRNSELSAYDRQSPLENHHLAVFLKLAEKHRL